MKDIPIYFNFLCAGRLHFQNRSHLSDILCYIYDETLFILLNPKSAELICKKHRNQMGFFKLKSS